MFTGQAVTESGLTSVPEEETGPTPFDDLITGSVGRAGVDTLQETVPEPAPAVQTPAPATCDLIAEGESDADMYEAMGLRTKKRHAVERTKRSSNAQRTERSCRSRQVSSPTFRADSPTARCCGSRNPGGELTSSGAFQRGSRSCGWTGVNGCCTAASHTGARHTTGC